MTDVAHPEAALRVSTARHTTLKEILDRRRYNPPWDVYEASSQEFFSDFDPIYRTYDKQAAVRKQAELFASVPDLDDGWGEYNASFKALANWTRCTANPFDMSLARRREG